MDAVLLLELNERRKGVRLLVRVHVERPVREVERLRQLVCALTGARRLRFAAAGGEKAGDGKQCAAGGAALQELAAGELIGHADPPRGAATKGASGAPLGGGRAPRASGAVARRSVGTTTGMFPVLGSPMYCVAT